MTEDGSKYLRSEARRGEIAAAASRLIVEKGMEGLRTREVAARVGINVATLHYHVPSREALLDLVIETMRKTFNGLYMQPASPESNGAQRLSQVVGEFRALMTERPDLLQLLDELDRYARVHPRLEETLRAMRVDWHLTYVSIFEQGKREGLFRETLDPVAAAHMTAGALVSFAYKPRHLLPHFDAVAEEIFRSVTAL